MCKFFNKMLRGFREKESFLKIFLCIYFEKFTYLFQSFTECFPLLLLDGLMMVTNKGTIAIKCK